MMDFFSKIRKLESSLFRPFEHETNREEGQDETGMEEVNFTVENTKKGELLEDSHDIFWIKCRTIQLRAP